MLSAFGIVFLAELGDKSMLFSLTAATRYRWWLVLAAVSIAAALIMGLAVLIGGIAGEVLPDRLVAVIAAALFAAFGIWTLLSDSEETAETVTEQPRSRLRILFALAGVFFLAELGDKTQVATLSLAGLQSGSLLLVWAGATTGLIAINALAIFAGSRLHLYLRPEPLRILAGTLFLVVAALTLIVAFY